MQHAQIRHPSIFLFLSFSLMALNTLAWNIAVSIFIDRVDSGHLPIAYILLGLLSIPITLVTSRLVDRYDRTRLFSYMLLGSIALFLGIRLLLNLESTFVAYAIFIAFYFQWNLIIHIMLPSLLADYFSTLDWKKYSTSITMAQGIGGILGGGLTSWFSSYMKTENMVLLLPIFSIVALGQIIYIIRYKKKIKNITKETQNSVIQSPKEFGILVKQYPIIFLLAIDTVVTIILKSFSEFEFFSIYARVFSDQETRTNFLGQMRMINSSLQLLILLFMKPLIQKLRVSEANLLYPSVSVGSFLTFAFQFNLRGAIVLDLHNNAFTQGLNVPVSTLNYNALPHRIIGQARSICDGLFYFIGLALGGGILWVAQTILTPFQMGFIGIGLSIIFWIARYQIGKSYLPTLMTTLQSNSVDLNAVSDRLPQLPNTYNSQIRQLLGSDRQSEQILGLELASRLSHPNKVLSSVDRLLANYPSEKIHQAAIHFLSIQDLTISRYLGQLLQSENLSLQRIALQSLIASKQPLTEIEVRGLLQNRLWKSVQNILSQKPSRTLRKQVREIQILAYIAAAPARNPDSDLQHFLLQKISLSALNNSSEQLIIIRAIRQSQNRELIPIVVEMLTHATAEVKIEALGILAELANLSDKRLAEMSLAELTHPDPFVRMAAFKLLGSIRHPKLLKKVALGLQNDNLVVRLHAAKALAQYGKLSFDYSQPLLDSSRNEVVLAAISAIAKVGNRRAQDILYNYLRPKYSLLADIIRWRQLIPSDAPNRLFLNLAIADYQARLVYLVLYTLSQLDRDGELSDIRILLHDLDLRTKANAIEALASGSHRRFILPIVPLLERPDGETSVSIWTSFLTKDALQQKIVASGDRWLIVAALLLTKKIVNFQNISDPITGSFVKYLNLENNFSIERLVFLKTVSLLNSLFLDELLQIHTVLIEENYRSGETIGTLGQPWNKLLIVYQGKIETIPSNAPESICMSQGDYFGAIALFQEISLEFTVVAHSDAKVLTLNRDEVQNLIEVCPRLLTCLSRD
ncbi:MAG: HEAT repeat domain-containing protein [Cyanobacteria bacterium SBLK]|nr:HEAT repeat domain-containing protein [Cyanobacteria bacterium SBLK]